MAHIITVDTNIWVSAFITPQGHPARLLQYWRADLFDGVISLPLLAELAEVLARPRLQTKYRYSSDEWPITCIIFPNWQLSLHCPVF